MAAPPVERIVRPKISDFPPLQVPSSSGSFGQVTIHRLSGDGVSHTSHRHERDAAGISSPRVALKRITVRRPGEGIPENLIREIVALKSIKVRVSVHLEDAAVNVGQTWSHSRVRVLSQR